MLKKGPEGPPLLSWINFNRRLSSIDIYIDIIPFYIAKTRRFQSETYKWTVVYIHFEVTATFTFINENTNHMVIILWISMAIDGLLLY